MGDLECPLCGLGLVPGAPDRVILSPEDVASATDRALDVGAADYVHLKIGYIAEADRGVGFLEPYLAELRKRSDVRISVELYPPADDSWVDRAYALGIEGIAFHLDVYDPTLWKEVCHHRARLVARERYMEALARAVEVFPGGAVISRLIVGLEPAESTRQGIEALAAMGVVPTLEYAWHRGAAPSPPWPLSELEDLVRHLYARARGAQAARHMDGRSKRWAWVGGHALVPWATERPSEGPCARSPSLAWETASPGNSSTFGGSYASARSENRSTLPDSDFPSARAQTAGRPPEDLVIDRRPLPVLVLVTYRRALALVGAAVVGLVIAGWELDPALSTEGQRALAVFATCAVLWVTQALPLAVTGLCAMALLPADGRHAVARGVPALRPRGRLFHSGCLHPRERDDQGWNLHAAGLALPGVVWRRGRVGCCSAS